MAEGGTAGGVAGEHRVDRMTLWWLWGAMAALWSASAVFNLLGGRVVLGGINAVAAALAVSVVLTSRSERTVVGPDGIRVKRGYRWRTVRWDDVEQVAEPDRWTWDRTLRVTTTAGEDVRLDVPGALRAQFIEYGQAHGLRSAPPEAPHHDTG
jgi:hypothetical protein